MSSFNKIKYSFVLCLALLFSFSFAGTLTVSGDDYDIPWLQDDYEIMGSYNYSLIYVVDYDNSTRYRLDIMDISRLDDTACIGSNFIWDYGDIPIYNLSFLKQKSNPIYYELSEPHYSTFEIYSDGSIYSADEGHNLTSSDFPYICSDYVNYNYNLIESYKSINVLHSTFDIYETDTENNEIILGDLFYGTDDGPSIPTFPNTLTQQQINSIINTLYSSPDVKNNLPPQYSRFFVKYSYYTDNIDVWFYPTNYTAFGNLYLDSEDDTIIDHYNFRFRSNNVTSLFTNTCYHFSKTLNDTNFYLEDTFNILDVVNESRNWSFDYYEEPIIYSSPTMDFFIRYSDGGLADSPSFTITPFDITDSNDDVVTINDVLSQNKDDNSIWTMLYNIFNPPTNTSNMSVIEGQHDSIINKANNQSFFDLFNNSKDLIVSITSVTWLLTASSLLFNYFSSFLVLCCVFLTISRVMR